MALLNSLITFSIVDDGGQSKPLPIYCTIADTDTFADIQSWVTEFSPLLEALLDGKQEKVTAKMEFTLPAGGKANPVAKCDVERGGLLTCSADSTKYAHSLSIPALKAALYVGDTVNIADPTVAAMFTYLSATNHLVTGSDKYGNHLTAIRKGRKNFRE